MRRTYLSVFGLVFLIGVALVVTRCDRRSVEELTKALPSANVKSAEKIERRAQALLDVLRAGGRGDTLQAADAIDLILESRIKQNSIGAEDSITLAESSLRIRQLADSPDLHHSFYLDGTATFFRGDLPHACTLMAQGVEVVERFGNAINPNDAAKTRMGYGILLDNTGRSPEARVQYEKALGLLNSAPHPDPQIEGKVLNNSGDLHVDFGEYDDAESQLKKALSIRTALDPNGVETAQTLSALGGWAQQLGDLDAAAEFYRHSREVFLKQGESFHSRVADVTNNAGLVEFERSDFETAGSLFAEALRLLSDKPGASLERAHVLSNQGELELVRNQLPARVDAAHDLFVKAFHLRCVELAASQDETADSPALQQRCTDMTTVPDPSDETAFGHWQALVRTLPTNPDIAESLSQLGRVDLAQGRAAAGRARLSRAVEMWCSEFGLGHRLCGMAKRDLARAEAATDAPQQAFLTALDADLIIRNHKRLTASRLPREKALRYANSLPKPVDLVVTLAEKDAGLWRKAYDSLIRSRGVILDEESARWEAANLPGNAEVIQARKEYDAASHHCSALSIGNQKDLDPADYVQALKAACEDADLKEKMLAKATERVDLLQERRNERDFGIDRIVDEARKLPADSALVSYVMYEGDDNEQWLGAFLLEPANGRIQFVRLEKTARVDTLVRDWREQLSADAHNLDEYRRVAGDLRSAVWDKVEILLGDRAKTIFVVPDGQLNFLSLATLPSVDGSYLIQSKQFHYLSVERDLVTRERAASNNVLVASGPAFEKAAARPVPAPADVVLDPGTLAFTQTVNEADRCLDVASPPHSAIQDAQSRAARLMQIAASGGKGNMRLLDRELSKPAFENLIGSFSDVYLLTHAEVDDPSAKLDDTDAAKRDPLLRSRLMLTGADCRKWSDPNNADTGVTTAKDLAGLNLFHVRSIVLHACKTGTGVDVRSGEGVMGLRRAAHTAGAGSIVMTLWEIDDTRTQPWMEDFFNRRFGPHPQSLVEAVNEATRDQIKAPGPKPHPYWWGGFVSAGDWK